MALLAAAIAAVVVPLTAGGKHSAGGRPTATAEASSYVVRYHVVENGVPSWEVLAASRPFTGSDLTYRTADAPSSSAHPDSGTISTETELFSVDGNGAHPVSGRQPGPPSADLQLGAELPELVSRGVAEDLHRTDRIAGHDCRLYRLAEPASGPVAALDPAQGHDDVCIAGDGLVVAETWTYHGRVVLERTADLVAADAPWPASVPRPPAVPPGLIGASAAAATVARAPAGFQAVIPPPAAPAGFTANPGAYVFRLPDPQQPRQIVAQTTIWVFTRGRVDITVEAGAQRGGVLPWSRTDTVTAPLRLAAGRPATTALRSDGPEVRIDLGQGQWVRVRGTVPLTTLSEFAASLRLT